VVKAVSENKTHTELAQMFIMQVVVQAELERHLTTGLKALQQDLKVEAALAVQRVMEILKAQREARELQTQVEAVAVLAQIAIQQMLNALHHQVVLAVQALL
jgi:hypothetical protein